MIKRLSIFVQVTVPIVYFGVEIQGLVRMDFRKDLGRVRCPMVMVMGAASIR